MKKIVSLFFTLYLAYNTVEAQIIYETISSSILGQDRKVKIQLPRGYSYNSNTKYPIFIVFDGDYMFESVAGNVDHISYWEDMPPAIVVGINQVDTHFEDCMFSEKNSLPVDSSANFFEFIGMELMPHIEKKYRAGTFRVAVGHGETANFINYYLLKPQPMFQGFICISPELAPLMIEYIPEAMAKTKSKTFYYLANSENDTKSIQNISEALNKNIASIKNDNLLYDFDVFKNVSHYSLPTQAIPKAIDKIFKIYQPISKKEYTEVILNLEISPVLYLQEKYQTISNLFDFDKPILLNDFKAIAAAIEKNETFEHYEELGKMARKRFPDALLGTYYIARFYEETGEPKKAMRTYQSAYTLEEIGGITKDLMLEKAELIKQDFGY